MCASNPQTLGQEMHALAVGLFSTYRSIMGSGLRRTVQVLQKHIPLTLLEVPTGSRYWPVPKEWNIRDA